MNSSAMHKKSFWLISILVLAALVIAACQPAAAPTTSAPTVAMAPTDTAAPMPTDTIQPTTPPIPATGGNIPANAGVNVTSDAMYGQILVDDQGLTLYIFKKDTPNQSNCTGNCLKSWPPLLTQDAPKAGSGVDASLLGTATLADGTKIVTYNKMPLYHFAKDAKPGDAAGQGVGGNWFVVSPMGSPVEPTPTAMASVSGTVNTASDPVLGTFLVDSNGMTLYMFAKDSANTSTCTGNCLKSWPPLLASGAVTGGSGVDASLLGTADLADGTKIVTYNKMPLYHFAKDAKAGDTVGQGVGGNWFAVAPGGSKIDIIPATATPAASSSEPTITVANNATLGNILVDGNGKTLYAFKNDGPNQSNCTANCLNAWPPLLTSGSPVAGAGITASLLGSATLADGRKIVTYNKMPLYYWAADTKAGDTNGQGVNNVWYTVSPDGSMNTGGASTGY